MSLIDRLRHRYAVSDDEQQAEELRLRSDALGVVPIAQAVHRSSVEVSGVVRTLTHPPSAGAPVELVVELYDGTGAIDVVWLGRRSIPGVRPGVHLRVHGRICTRRGVRTMFNPRYEIVPGV